MKRSIFHRIVGKPGQIFCIRHVLMRNTSIVNGSCSLVPESDRSLAFNECIFPGAAPVVNLADKNVLLIEDEQEISDILKLHLEDNNFKVKQAADGLSGLTLALQHSWDVIIMDLTLPKLDGLDICEQVRSTNPLTPIIVISARNAEFDRIRGLNLGADDYISKPFSLHELVARVNAVLRRVESGRNLVESEVISVNGISLDVSKHSVLINNQSIKLTRKEFELLLIFVRSPEQVFSRTELLEMVWGYTHEGYLHTVNSHINRLRTKIEPNPAKPFYIKTVWGVGYKLSTCIE